MLDIFIFPPVNKGKRSADARIDLHTHHVARWRREQPFAGICPVQPGIEDLPRRLAETVDDANFYIWFIGHGNNPFDSGTLFFGAILM
jgi:hypothetical protein